MGDSRTVDRERVTGGWREEAGEEEEGQEGTSRRSEGFMIDYDLIRRPINVFASVPPSFLSLR